MINPKSGQVCFQDSFSLSPHLVSRDIEALVRKEMPLKTRDQQFIQLGEHPTADYRWGVAVVIKNDRLHQILLQCLDAPELIDMEWNITTEKRRQTVHDNILIQQLGNQKVVMRAQSGAAYEFPWGRVSSDLDFRGVQAVILVEYF